MKIEQSCNPNKPGPSIFAIKVGTVFSYHYDSDKSEIVYCYLRVTGGAMCLVRSQFFSDNNFGASPLPNYKEYPNARVVLE